MNQAIATAKSMLDKGEPYNEVPWFWSDQYDLKLQIAGLSGDHDQIIVRGNPKENRFSACYLRAGRLVAVEAVNSPRDFMFGKKLIAAEVVVTPEQVADSAVSLGDLL